jgi:hypothetical protein
MPEPTKEDLIKERNILSDCALRFDGYKYEKNTKFNFKQSIKKIIEGKALEPLEKLAIFFFLQRSLSKWDLQFEEENKKVYKVYRDLFLACVDLEIPQQYQKEDYLNNWRKNYEPNIEEVKNMVSMIHENTSYS